MARLLGTNRTDFRFTNIDPALASITAGRRFAARQYFADLVDTLEHQTRGETHRSGC